MVTGMFKRFVALIIASALFFMSGCSGKSPEMEIVNFFAMDTVMSIAATGDNAEKALKDCVGRVGELEQLLSVNIGTSDIARINRDNGATAVSEVTATLLERSLKYGKETNGAFDVTILPIVRLWNIKAENPRVPEGNEIAKALEPVDYSQISVTGRAVSLKKDGAGIDLGGIAKGYAADEIARILRENGIECALFSLGGNVGVLGEKLDGEPWRVGIRDPNGQPNDYVGILELRNTFAVTSGGYERSFEKEGVVYHHIFDPSTGYPSDSGLISVTIIADDSAYADMLSTALYVMGYDEALKFYENHNDFEAVFITDQNEVYCTPGTTESFYLTATDSYRMMG